MSSKRRLRRRLAVATAALALPASAAFLAPAPSHGCCADPSEVPVSVEGTICWEKGSTPTQRPVVVVSLPSEAKSPVSVVLTTSDGSAVAPADYAPIKGTVVTIPAGASRVEVPLTIESDGLVESLEWFTVTITKPSSGTIGKGTAYVAIQDGSAP